MSGKYRPLGDEVTAGYLLALAKEARIRREWISLQGKVFAPDEVIDLANADSFTDLYTSEVKLVDPVRELARADRIIKKLVEKRNEFELRIKKFGK
ncbi:MAG: hypothetical protein EPN37_07290 [Chitinophagaceae bacterium]|nr:MAG: hypothetical protein EPN37_07290 [Chitinophagaceae bacterium]